MATKSRKQASTALDACYYIRHTPSGQWLSVTIGTSGPYSTVDHPLYGATPFHSHADADDAIDRLVLGGHVAEDYEVRRIEVAIQAKRSGARRLLVVTACGECPHSRNSSVCFHPDTPGRHRLDGFRALPDVPGYRWPEHAPPPAWCPLPHASSE